MHCQAALAQQRLIDLFEGRPSFSRRETILSLLQAQAWGIAGLWGMSSAALVPVTLPIAMRSWVPAVCLFLLLSLACAGALAQLWRASRQRDLEAAWEIARSHLVARLAAFTTAMLVGAAATTWLAQGLHRGLIGNLG